MTAEEPRGHRRGRGRGRAVAGGAVAVVAAGAATAATIGFGFGSETDGTAQERLPPATATVTRQTLDDTRTVDGTLAHGDPTTLSARLAGTVTALPYPGSVVARGKALYSVDDAPVVLLYGGVPAYRALRPGDEGADVKQLEQNLKALGYSGFTVDDAYTPATASAVRDWQEDLGLAETGRVELGRVVFAPGAIRVESVTAGLGGQVGPGQPVLAYTGTARVVTVRLAIADQRLARAGTAVAVTLPDGANAKGSVRRVYTVIEASDDPNGDPETEIEAEITLADDKAAAGLDVASVEVAFTAGRHEDVLTVPVAALVALAEGGYGVEVVEGTTSRYTRVETGLFAGGRVEISGEGIAEGVTVGIPR